MNLEPQIPQFPSWDSIEPAIRSGTWRGYIQDNNLPDQQHRLELVLTFWNGRIAGHGEDLQPYIIKGYYSGIWAEFIQHYASHKVLFFCEVIGRTTIEGTWKQSGEAVGNFRLRFHHPFPSNHPQNPNFKRAVGPGTYSLSTVYHLDSSKARTTEQ